MVDEGFFERSDRIQPAYIEPKVIDEETWDFEEESLSLIINNLTLHWVNNLEQTFKNFNKSLESNGVYLGTLFGDDTLQELRITFNLAEAEREGGYSPTTSPMISMTDIGNTFAKCNFKLPTIDRTIIQMEFQTMYHLIDYLRFNGDIN